MEQHVVATYLVFDKKGNFEQKAEKIAVGLTVGSWTGLPAAQKEHMRKHLGKVVDVQELETDGVERKAFIRIAYPEINFSADIPALLVTVFGKLSMDGKIKLVDLELSSTFSSHFQGPAFGIEGIREQLGVYDRPLLMSIFKSCIGQDLDSHREQFYQQALGGVDLIKDDEILFENRLTPLDKRLEAALEAAERAREQTGQQVLYAVNLTGPSTDLVDRAIFAVEKGANAILFNVFAYGFDALQRLSEDPDIHVPIMAHPAFAGAIYPSPHHGLSAELLLGKLLRLAGADLVLFPSPYGSVAMRREETLGIAQQLRADWQVNDRTIQKSFPVPSAGIHPGIAPLLYDDFGLDSVMNAGGGIHGHPGGAAAGGRAFRQAIDILVQGGKGGKVEKVEEQAHQHEELKQALDMWGIAQR